MKKLLILAVVSLICTANIVAQECNLCGTWSGTYKCYRENVGDITKKMLIRINRYEEKYRIRIKEFPVSNPSDIDYWEDCIITYNDDNSISFIRKREREPWIENGKTVSSFEATDYYHVKFSEGCLYFRYDKFIVTNFDLRGNLINKEEYSGYRNVTLYKDEYDW